MHRGQNGGKPRRFRFQQSWQVEAFPPDADTELPQRRTILLGQLGQLFRDLFPPDIAEPLFQAKNQTADRTPVGAPRRPHQGLQIGCDPISQPRIENPFDPAARGSVQQLAPKNSKLRQKGRTAGQQAGEGLSLPLDESLIVEDQIAGGRLFEPEDPTIDLGVEGLHGRIGYRPAGQVAAGAVRGKAKAVHAPDIMPFDQNVSGPVDQGSQVFPVLQPFHQYCCPLIDEPLSEAVVQGVGELVLDFPRSALPGLRVIQPIGPVGNVGPDAHPADTAEQGLDIAIRSVDAADMTGHPVVGQLAIAIHEMGIDLTQ